MGLVVLKVHLKIGILAPELHKNCANFTGTSEKVDNGRETGVNPNSSYQDKLRYYILIVEVDVFTWPFQILTLVVNAFIFSERLEVNIYGSNFYFF